MPLATILGLDATAFWTMVGVFVAALIGGIPLWRTYRAQQWRDAEAAKKARQLELEAAEKNGEQKVRDEFEEKSRAKEQQLFMDQTRTLLTSTADMKRELKADIQGVRTDQAAINERLLKHEAERADVNSTLLRHETTITDDRHETRGHLQRIETKVDALAKRVETLDGTISKSNGNH